MGNNNSFDIVAASTKFIRLQRNIDQETAANESGVSLRTIQNVEAGKAVNSTSLFAYLDYLDLLNNMLSTLPDPDKLTPLELLESKPRRRARARKSATKIAEDESVYNTEKQSFKWGDE